MTTAASVKVRSGGGFVSLLDVFFPVGSLYLTYSNTNPSKFLGGSWALYSSDRYLRGGASNAAVGGTGGSNTISVNQMPQHSHLMQSMNWQNWASTDQGVANRYCVANGANAGYDGLNIVGNTGGGLRSTRRMRRYSLGDAPRRGGAPCELGSRTGTGSSTTAPTPSGHGFIASSTRTENGPEPAGRGMARARISSRRARRTRTCRTTARTRTSSPSVRCRLIHILGVVTGRALALVETLMEWQRGGEPGTSPWFTTLGRVAEGHTTTCRIPWPSPFGGVWGSLSTSWGGGLS